MAPDPIKYSSKILEITAHGRGLFDLHFERPQFTFQPGQEITIYGELPGEERIYSIASGMDDDELVIHFRLISGGALTPRLATLQPGDTINWSGAIGRFVLRTTSSPIYFFATGTGVAPALSFFHSYPDLDLTVIHGVRAYADLVYEGIFSPQKYHPCISREKGSAFHGHVTDYMHEIQFPDQAWVYLCGANEMILDAREILQQHEFPHERTISEAYYYGSTTTR